jgi:hypothetical protein
LLLASLFRPFVFQALLSRHLITARGTERRAPDSAQLLSFGQQPSIDRNVDGLQMFKPADRFVYFFDNRSELPDELGRGAARLAAR